MGTSNENVIPAFANEDHPHAYGDKTQKMIEKKYCEGSSPRVWGQADKETDNKEDNRIIPTRMGTSFIGQHLPFRTWDHPHAYGDK